MNWFCNIHKVWHDGYCPYCFVRGAVNTSTEPLADESPIKEESHNNPLPHDIQKWIENDAGELIKKFGNEKLALIYVDGIIDFMMNYDERHNSCLWANSSEMRYWCEVKQFIEKL